MLKISSFQESLKASKGVVPKFEKGTNIVKFLMGSGDGEEKKISITPTDMIENINVYVRIIMNVQLFGWTEIDEVLNGSKEVVNNFKEKFGIADTSYQNVKSSGNSFVSKIPIITWITVDIPFIQSEIASVNSVIAEITGKYKQYCETLNIIGEERFVIAKFIASINTVYENDTYSGLIIGNFQKPNANVNNISTRLNVPSDIIIYKPTGKNSEHLGCDLSIVNNIDNNFPIEIVFDDRVKICEFNVTRFVKKTETHFFPQYSSRTINIYKKNKTSPLIKNVDGDIEVGLIDFNYREHPKNIGIIEDYVNSFLENSSKLSVKSIKSVSYIIGKIVTNKVMRKVTNVEV